MAFERATRKNTHVLIGMTGHSGTGKTYSALLLARGLVGEAGKIALIDTENGRGSMYSGLTEYDVDELHPPFSPERYADKVREAEKLGYGALIIDSFSHEWEGEGGVCEMADKQTSFGGKPLQGLAKWNKPKSAHKKLVNAILQSRMHIIICMRGKDKLIQAKDDRGKEVIVNAGVVPIQDSRFIFEMTVSLIMNEAKHYEVKKCPDDLLAAFPANSHVTERSGKAIADWVSGGVAIDHELEALKQQGRDAALSGTESLQAFWKGLGGANQKKLVDQLDGWKETAADCDMPVEEGAAS